MPLVLALELGKGGEEVSLDESAEGGGDDVFNLGLVATGALEGLDSKDGLGAEGPAAAERAAVVAGTAGDGSGVGFGEAQRGRPGADSESWV